MPSGDVVADRFELLGPAGSGGMGRVYRALDRQTGEIVAVKMLLSPLCRRDRFDREAALLESLSHPGIVRYVAHGSTGDNEPFLCMEWLEGPDLARRLAAGPLAVPESLLLVERVAGALGVAHRRGVVHRDLKPQNLILVDGRVDRVKLIDFGLARGGDGDPIFSLDGMVVGTPGYMAPEQARGVSEVSPAADVFALGCVLFESLAGRPAFVAGNAIALLGKIIIEEVPSLAELRDDVSAELDALLAAMLAKDADARPSDGDALCAAIARLGQGLPPARTIGAGRPAITMGEQRLFCVVLIRLAAGPALASAVTLPAGEADSHDFLRRVVTVHGGKLETMVGDAAMLVFSGKAGASELVLRAARCALALRDGLPEARVALATGRSEGVHRLPVSEVLDRASALLGGADAPAGQVRLDELSERLLGDRFVVGEDGLGRRLERAADEGDLGHRLLGRPTSCVGRERELALLDGEIVASERGEGAAAVLVLGAPGLGKSRLVDELRRRVEQRGSRARFAAGRGDPLASDTPFALVASLLRRTLGASAEALAARLAGLGVGERERVTDFLTELIGAPHAQVSPMLAAARHDAQLMFDQLRRAFEDACAALCREAPLVLVLDDVHWADTSSLRLVDGALRNLADLPFAVLATARPEIDARVPGLWSERRLTRVSLSPLPRRAAERLVHEALPGSDAGLRARVVDAGAGNPFFLEELARSAAEGAPDQLPASVVALGEARIATLPAAARRVLRAASVLGRGFTRDGLETLLGGEEDTWLPWLCEHEALEATEGGFAFRHDVVREAAYAMLTASDRALGHRLAAGFLAERGGDAAAIAEHFRRGEEPARAAEWYRVGARAALDGHDLRAALTLAERGLACDPGTEAAAGLRLVKASARFWRGEYGEALQLAADVAQVAEPGSPLWLQAVAELVASLGQSGRYDEVLAWTEEARARPGADLAERLFLYARAAGYLVDGGRYAEAEALCAEVEAGAGTLPALAQALTARARHARAKRAIFTGDLGGARAGYAAVVEASLAIGDRRAACENQVNLGFILAELGDQVAAEATMAAGLAVAEELDLPSIVAGAQHNLGPVLARLGRLGEAEAHEQRAVAFFHASADRRLEGMSRAYLALIQLEAGRLAEAEAEARRALDVLDGVPPARASAEAALARVLLARGRADDARVASGAVLAALRELGGIEDYEAMAHDVHARALLAGGRDGEAREVLAAACERLLARARKIEDVDVRRRYLADPPDNAALCALARSVGALPDEAARLLAGI